MIWHRLRSKESLIAFLVGWLLFEAGLLMLQHNPYWRTAAQVGIVPHHIYAWNSSAHLIIAIGLILVFGGTAYLPSRFFSGKWLYWTGVALAVVLWCGTLGVVHTYAAHYAWDARTGVTEFAISNSAAPQQPENVVWQTIVRWQIEPELSGWISASPLKRTHGSLCIEVARIVPIAVPTLDCDCLDCCVEVGTKTSVR